jgi:diaminopimelate decarboxylase
MHYPSNIQGVSFADIAAQFGTPVYIYDAQTIVRQVSKLKEYFAGTDLKVKFAAKALTNISILSLLRSQEVGVDAVSVNEARIAIRCGFSPAEINYTPSAVGFAEIEEAVGLGLSLNLDSLPALEKFGKRYGGSYPCGIRLNPSIMAGGNLKISTGHVQSKFGISIDQIKDIHQLVRQHNINISGLHIHTGSEIVDTSVFMKMAGIFFDLAKDFPSLKFIDFGGGFKVAYRDGDKVTDMTELGREIGNAFAQFEKATGRKLQCWIEPGKYLVSEAGILLVKTNVVKKSPALTFVGVDSGLNHLIRPMMYNAYHEIVNISNPLGSKQTYTVVGNICETDTLGADRELNEVRENDLLAILNAGAYGYSMSSTYNSRFRPAEVLVVNGKANLVRERETFDDLLRGQHNVIS